MKITCNCKTMRNVTELEDFQKGIKTISDKNLDKLIMSIETNGFNVPFIVWGNKIMDGHQRIKALEKMGYLGEVPVVELEAENEAHAKEILLNVASQHGRWDIQALEEYTKGLVDIDTTSLVDGPTINLDFKVDTTPVTPLIDDIEIIDSDEYEKVEVEEIKTNTGEVIDFPDGSSLTVGSDRYFAEECVRMWNNRNRTMQVEL